MTALQSEYSLWTRDPEAKVLPLLRELRIGFVAYSPLGRGFLTGRIRSTDQFDATDLRKSNPRFSDENFEHDLRAVDEVEAVAAEMGAAPACGLRGLPCHSFAGERAGGPAETLPLRRANVKSWSRCWKSRPSRRRSAPRSGASIWPTTSTTP